MPKPSLCQRLAETLGHRRGGSSAPDILLLDEPTNHLDLAAIEWLEALLQTSSFACVVVSHDRYFLENVATDMAELNRTYPDGVLRVSGSYSRFLEKKEEFLHAQSKRQEALEIWYTGKSSGCAGVRRHGQGSPKRGLIKPGS